MSAFKKKKNILFVYFDFFCTFAANLENYLFNYKYTHMKKFFPLTTVLLLSVLALAQTEDVKLTGTPMGSSPSWDYDTNEATTEKNLPQDAFDGDLETFFASSEKSYTWVGLDLGEKHVITRVGWCPKNTEAGRKRMMLGVFEGANSEDFMDAMPLYVIPDASEATQMYYVDVNCSVGFRYVRYIGPSDGKCNVAELEFYGHSGEGDSTKLYRPTNLPCVVIHTKDNEEPYDKENYIRSVVTILSESQAEWGEAKAELLQDSAGIRLRGNASMKFPKKPYRIKFDNKHKVLGGVANAKNWVLVNNYGDKTLMRNMVAFHVSEIFEMPYTPYCQPVDVLVNGEYKGCYQLCDKIEVKKGRVNIDEMKETDIEGDKLTGGYLWEIDGYASQEDDPFYTPHNMPITIDSPKDDEIVPEQRAYFEEYFSTLENNVYEASESNDSWREYIDYSTFARYFLINQVCANPDAFWQCYMYKKRNDMKAYTGPVWDFDLGFDNDKRQYPMCERPDFIWGGASNTSAFTKHVVQADQSTTEEMLAHWDLARNSGIDEQHLCAFVDSVAQVINGSQELNFKRWPILDQLIHQNPVALGSYEAEVNRLKEFIGKRIEWVDNKLGYTPTPTAIEKVGADTPGYNVYDIYGRMIYSGDKLPQLPAGLYILQHNGKTEKRLYY